MKTQVESDRGAPSGPRRPDETEPRHGARKQRRVDLLKVFKVAVYAFFGVFLFLPLVSLFIVAFTEEPANLLGSIVDGDIRSTNLDRLGGASLGAFVDGITERQNAEALRNSLLLATGVAAVSTVVSIPIAFAFARTAMPGKKTFMVLSTIPIVVPTMVGAAGFVAMFGRSGWFTMLWQSVGLAGNPVNPYSLGGLVIVLVLFLFPFVLWPMVAAFKIADATIEGAAQNLGARSKATFATVTVPLALPGIVSAALLIFAIAFSDFGAAIILAPPELNLIVVNAYREVAAWFNWAGAAVLVTVMVAVVAAFYGLQRLALRGRDYGTLTARGARAELNTSRRLNRGLAIYTGIVLLVPTLVLLSVLIRSFATTWSGVTPAGYTLAHYDRVVARNLDNIGNSLVLSAGALAISLAVVILIAYFVQRENASGLDLFATIPLVIPGIAIGIALIQSFNTAPLPLHGTAFLVVVAYAIRRLPYMLRSTSGSMQAIGGEVEEAAWNLGASRLVGLATTVLPLLRPALITGGILVFITVIKETSITVLMAPADWQPMSYAIFQSLHRGELGSGSALSVVLVVIVVILQQIAYRLSPGGIEGT